MSKKNRYGHNFQNIASKLNQRGLIVYEPTLIQFGAAYLENCGRIYFFGRLIILLTDPILSHSPNFGRPKQGQTFVVPTFHIHLLLLDMSTFDIEHYSSGNENIHTKLFETSHPAGKQITTVNIFQLSLSTKMLSEVMFS